ncbi:MAG TPA: hypothetical protein VNO31_47310, partial [Umezawaea sp.]|nr:hypothetical protein [Umezawaea sp.]
MPKQNLQARGPADGFLEGHAGLRIDGARLLDRLEELAKIGADPAGGITRLGLSAQENAAMA